MVSAKTLAATGGAFVLGIAVSYWYLRRPAPPPPKPAVAPAPVVTEVQLVGKLRARHVVDVPPPQNGTPVAFFADVGQEVYEGQLLARLSNEDLENSRNVAQKALDSANERVSALESQVIAARLDASRARAEAVRARAEFDRLSRAHERQKFLYSEGATPKMTLDKTAGEYELAKTSYESVEQSARAAEGRVDKILRDVDAAKRVVQEKQDELDGAQEDLGGSELISPVTGIVIGRTGELGQPVGRSQTDFFQIASKLEDMDAVCDATPDIQKDIHAGQPALVMIAEQGTDGLTAAVKGIDNGRVIVEFVNPNPGIRPGMSALVKIRLK